MKKFLQDENLIYGIKGIVLLLTIITVFYACTESNWWIKLILFILASFGCQLTCRIRKS